MESITAHPEHGEVAIDWTDETTAIPALMDAARVTYGGIVTHDIVREFGDPEDPAPIAT